MAITKLPVVLCVDRAGLVGEDGETHQGMFDVPYLTTIPQFELWSPSSLEELRRGLRQALAEPRGPVAIRYPRGGEGVFTQDTFGEKQAVLRAGRHVTLVAYGIMVNEALDAADRLAQCQIEAEVIKLNCCDILDAQVVLESVGRTGRLAVLEDCCDAGC